MAYVSHCLLVVSDLDESVSFYESYTHLEVTHRRERADPLQRIAWLGAKGSSFRVILVAGPPGETPVGPYGHIGVSCTSRREYSALLEKATRHGLISGGPAKQPWPVCEWFSIRDPDRNRIEISLGQDQPPPLGAGERATQ